MKYLAFFTLLTSVLLGNESMVKVVYRMQGPDIEPGAYAGLPRTVYRVGQEMGRVEETLDQDFGMHALIILNGRDVWMINRMSESGMHFTAPDPDRGFRVPIVPFQLPAESRPAEGFEIGREVAFMIDCGAKPIRRVEDCNHYDVYETVIDGVTLTVFSSPETNLPVRTQVREGKKLLVDIAYDAYEVNLPVDPKLFRPDSDLEITEHSRSMTGSVASVSN